MKRSVSAINGTSKEPTSVISYRSKKKEFGGEGLTSKIQKNQPSYREIRETKTIYMLKKKQSEINYSRETDANCNKENINKPSKERSVSPNVGSSTSASSVSEKHAALEQKAAAKKSANSNKLPESTLDGSTSAAPILEESNQDTATSSAISKNIVKRFEAFLGQLHEEKKKFYKKISDRRSKYSLIQDSNDLADSRFPYEEIEESNNMKKLMELPVDELLKTLRSNKTVDSGSQDYNSLLATSAAAKSEYTAKQETESLSKGEGSGSSTISLLDETVEKNKAKQRGSFGNSQTAFAADNYELSEFLKTERELNRMEQNARENNQYESLASVKPDSLKGKGAETLSQYGTLQNSKMPKPAHFLNPFKSAPGCCNVSLQELRAKAEKLQKTIGALDFQIAKLNSETLIAERDLHEMRESTKEDRLKKEEEEQREIERIERECNEISKRIGQNQQAINSEKKQAAALKKKVADNKEFITGSEDLKKFLNNNLEKVVQQYERQIAERVKAVGEKKETGAKLEARLQAVDEQYREIKLNRSPEAVGLREDFINAHSLPKECVEMENNLRDFEEEQERIFIELHTELMGLHELGDELKEAEQLKESNLDKKLANLQKEKAQIIERYQPPDFKELEEDLCSSEIDLARLESELIEKRGINYEEMCLEMKKKMEMFTKNIEKCQKKIPVLKQEISNLTEIKAGLSRETASKLEAVRQTHEYLTIENETLKRSLEEHKEARQGIDSNYEQIADLESEINQELEEKSAEAVELRAAVSELESPVSELQKEKEDIQKKLKELNTQNSELANRLEKMDLVIEQYMSDSLEIKSENKKINSRKGAAENELIANQSELKDQKKMLESLKIGLEKQLDQINDLNQAENQMKYRVRRLESVSKLE